VALAVGSAVARPIRKLSRDNDEFREDWYGRSARPGVAAQPGVMERLGRIEHSVADKTLAIRLDGLEKRFDDHLHGQQTTT
jgi:hypothetical protein